MENARMDASATTQEQADAILLDRRPPQGCWSEKDYLWLTDSCNRFIEFTNGCIEKLPTPTDTHQGILSYLNDLFRAYILPRGVVRFSVLRLRIRARKFREPDLLLLQDAEDGRCQDRYWTGADLVVEVVSPDDPDRDYITKRADYAEAGIPEYWIVDPQQSLITVLTLAGETYTEHGEFHPGDTATSALLPDFTADVTKVLKGS